MLRQPALYCRTTRRTALAFTVCAALVAASCGGDDDAADTVAVDDGNTAATSQDDGQDEPSSTPESTVASTDPVDATPAENADDDIKVALVVHFQSPFTEEMQRGAKAAAGELGAELVLAGPVGFDTPQQVAQFNDVIAAGAQGVAVVPYPEEQWLRPLEDAANNGVLIAGLNVPVFDGQDWAPLYVGVNEVNMGRAIAKIAVDSLGDDLSGQVVVGNCLPGVQVLVDRVDGIKEVFAERAPDVEVLGDFDTTGDPTSNYAAWEALFLKYDDAIAFMGVCAPDLPNMVRAKETLGNDAVIVGNDFDPEAIRGLEEGIAQGSVGQSPYLQGYVPIRALIESLRAGEDLPTGWVDSGIEVVATPEEIESLVAITSSDDAYEEHYNARAQEVFDDFLANVKPLAQIRE